MRTGLLHIRTQMLEWIDERYPDKGEGFDPEPDGAELIRAQARLIIMEVDRLRKMVDTYEGAKIE
jgi:hypothetical protein